MESPHIQASDKTLSALSLLLVRMRRRYVGFVIVALGLALVPYILHLRVKSALVSYRNRLLATGEKLSISELMPASVPMESNSVPVFLSASGRLRVSNKLLDESAPPAMAMAAPGKAIVSWEQPDVRDDSHTNSWPEIEAAVEPYRPALEDLQDIIDHPVLDFHLDYHGGPTLLLPHLAPLKQATQRLSVAALCDLHQGKTSLAITNVRTMLAIANGMTDERLIISQLVRAAITQIALAANWSVLQTSNLNDGELATLQHDWAKLRFVTPAENALLMERATTEETLARMRDSSAQYQQVTGMFGGGSGGSSLPNTADWVDRAEQVTRDAVQGAGRRTMQVLWQNGWSYQDELKTLRGDQVLLEGVRRFKGGQPFHQVLHWQDEQLAALGFQERSDDSMMLMGQDLRSLFSGTVLAVRKFMNRIVQAEVACQFGQTAIALKRYQINRGTYPPGLANLVPDFLPRIPLDPFDGKPLRYKLGPDGAFLLYSIGEDGEDNGGDPTAANQSRTLSWQNGRDLVWPQPANSEEIAGFYRKLSKRSR